MLRKLRAQNTSLGEDLVNALCKCITQHRNILRGVLQYLQNPNISELEPDGDDVLFSVPNIAQIRTVIKALVERLVHSDVSKMPDSDSNPSTHSNSNNKHSPHKN